MRGLRFAGSAIDDLDSILTYLARETGDVETAIEFTDHLKRRCARLADLPGTLGTARPDVRADLRSVPHKGYVIFFRYTNDAVEIVNVLHASRDVIAYYRDEGPESD